MCLSLVMQSSDKKWESDGQWAHRRHAHDMQQYILLTMKSQRLTLLRKYERHLIYYKRFIDDCNGLWNNHDDLDAWNRFKVDVDDFGSLRWGRWER